MCNGTWNAPPDQLGKLKVLGTHFFDQEASRDFFYTGAVNFGNVVLCSGADCRFGSGTWEEGAGGGGATRERKLISFIAVTASSSEKQRKREGVDWSFFLAT